MESVVISHWKVRKWTEKMESPLKTGNWQDSIGKEKRSLENDSTLLCFQLVQCMSSVMSF